VTTNTAASIVPMCLSWVLSRKADSVTVLNGMRAGLVVVTAPHALSSTGRTALERIAVG